MAKLVCRASELKCDRYQFKADTSSGLYCDLCQNFAIEDVEHLVMQCPFLGHIRTNMYTDIENLEVEYQTRVLNIGVNNLHVLLGKIPEGTKPDFAFKVLKTISTYVYRMYMVVIRHREGIG